MVWQHMGYLLYLKNRVKSGRIAIFSFLYVQYRERKEAIVKGKMPIRNKVKDNEECNLHHIKLSLICLSGKRTKTAGTDRRSMDG